MAVKTATCEYRFIIMAMSAPEPLMDDLRVDALPEHERGARVAEIVESDR